jgi:hypothetical protein
MGISHALARWFSNYDSPKSVGSKLRTKRITPLLEMIEAVFEKKGHVNIIDLGGTEKYWNIISKPYLYKYRVSITIINLPGTLHAEADGCFKFIEGDACNLSDLADGAFDIVHSNSVVEHVGDWERMLQFAKETSRLASNYFVQTPNYWFPIEPHCMTLFFHWFPEPIRIWLVLNFQLGHWKKATSTSEAVQIVQSARLLDKDMFQALFDDAVVKTEKLFFLSKSFIAIRSKDY